MKLSKAGSLRVLQFVPRTGLHVQSKKRLLQVNIRVRSQRVSSDACLPAAEMRSIYLSISPIDAPLVVDVLSLSCLSIYLGRDSLRATGQKQRRNVHGS